MNDKFAKYSADVISMVRNGYTFSAAAAKVGIQPVTVANWRSRGKADFEHGRETRYAQFWRDSEDARFFAVSMVENVLFSDAMNGNVSAAIKWLERQAPEEWSKSTEEQAVNILTRLADDIERGE